MIAIVVAAIGSAVLIGFVLLAYQQARHVEFRGRSFFHGSPMVDEDPKPGRNSQSYLLKFRTDLHHGPTSLSFSNDHLLPSDSPPLFDHSEASATDPCSSSGRKFSPCSPLAASVEEQSVVPDLRSPDRFLGELFLIDTSLVLTVEQLARAPSEILGRSSIGTCYRAILESGHREMTVKWLSAVVLKNEKEFCREAQRIASLQHCHIRPLRAYYLGVRKNDRLLVSDYTHGDNLAHHLYETAPSKKKHSLLSFPQRLRIAIDIAECLLCLHDRSLPHGNIKPSNILLEHQSHNILLTDYALHRLLTPRGIADQMLNLAALGYLAPELGHGSKPAVPSLKADVYAFGVVLMELLTRKCAGDIISGQTGAVDLTDWVQLCDREGRRMDCLDKEILTSGGEQHTEAMHDLLSLSLRCVLPVKHRPNIRQVLKDVYSISSA